MGPLGWVAVGEGSGAGGGEGGGDSSGSGGRSSSALICCQRRLRAFLISSSVFASLSGARKSATKYVAKADPSTVTTTQAKYSSHEKGVTLYAMVPIVLAAPRTRKARNVRCIRLVRTAPSS